MKEINKDLPLFAFKISVLMLFTTMFLGMFIIADAHGQIGIGTTAPDTNTVLDVKSESKGILIPRMTKKQLEKINDPPSGLMVYVTDANEVGDWFYINGLSFYYIYETRGRLWIYDGEDWGEVRVKHQD